jgi:hypothetical protein
VNSHIHKTYSGIVSCSLYNEPGNNTDALVFALVTWDGCFSDSIEDVYIKLLEVPWSGQSCLFFLLLVSDNNCDRKQWIMDNG